MSKNRRGRPMASNNIEVTPEFRNDPDVSKLAHALISIAIQIAEQKEDECGDCSQNLPLAAQEDSLA